MNGILKVSIAKVEGSDNQITPIVRVINQIPIVNLMAGDFVARGLASGMANEAVQKAKIVLAEELPAPVDNAKGPAATADLLFKLAAAIRNGGYKNVAMSHVSSGNRDRIIIDLGK